MRTRDKEWLRKILEEDRYPQAYLEFYSGCKEPGYDDRPVILGDWNHVPDKVFNKLERLGFSCEWSDEWSSCSDCGHVFRTSPDSYHWQGSYWMGDGEIFCLDCLENHLEEYFESLENNPRLAMTWPVLDRYNPVNYGYELVKDGFENGFYDGQNDNPVNILKTAQANKSGKYIFAMTNQGQFDIEFALYRKLEDSDNGME